MRLGLVVNPIAGMGGRLAFLGAATKPVFTAAIPYYGGGMMTHWGEGAPTPFESVPVKA